MEKPELYHANKNRGRSAEQISEIRKQVRQTLRHEFQTASGKTAIISAESLFYFSENELRSLVEFILGCGRLVDAVGYIRAPKGYIESMFQQRVKGGLGCLNVSALAPRYQSNLEKFEIVLGTERVQYWHFSPATLSSGCVVQDFCRRLGIEFRPEDVVRVNEGLSLPAVSLLYTYRKFGPGYGVGPGVVRENNRLVIRVASLPGEKLRFHSDLVVPVIDSIKSDLAWMERRLGTSLSESPAFNDAHAIRSESDLLTFAPETLHWLAGQLGIAHLKGAYSKISPKEVALCMQQLRRKLADEDTARGAQAPGSPQGHELKVGITELVGNAKTTKAEVIELIPDSTAACLLRESLALVAKAVAQTTRGVVRVEGFGSFVVRDSPSAQNEASGAKGVQTFFVPEICTELSTDNTSTTSVAEDNHWNAGRRKLEQPKAFKQAEGAPAFEVSGDRSRANRIGSHRKILRPKRLSQFRVANDFESLVASAEDSIFLYSPSEHSGPSRGIYLNDIDRDRSYVLKLHHAKLFPWQWLNGLANADSVGAKRLPGGLKRLKEANLLLAADDRIVSDSIFRYGFVPPGLEYLTDDTWGALEPEEFVEIDEPCLFVDLVCGHFGHALVETPGRLWPLVTRHGAILNGVTAVGFGTHRINNDKRSWPAWLTQLLRAYGIDSPETIQIVTVPTRCRSLIVPKRISPFYSDNGKEYDDVIRSAGNRLEAEQRERPKFGTKLFLSRSKLHGARRGLPGDTAQKLDGIFRDLGYDVIHPEELSLADQVIAVRGATHIVGCVGSQLHLVAFSNNPVLKVLRIAPSFFAPAVDQAILSEKGIELQDYLIDFPLDPAVRRGEAGWDISASELDAISDFVRSSQ